MDDVNDYDELRAQILGIYGLKPWDIGAAPVPLRVRIWRALTCAYARGKAIDWRSYNKAEAEYRASQEAFMAGLPRRKQEIVDELSKGLPDGMRFEWAPDE